MRGERENHVVRGWRLIVASCLFALACSSSRGPGQDQVVAKAKLGETCDADSCEAGLRCELTCTKSCTNDSDCPKSRSGAASYCDLGACRTSCTTDADCPYLRCNIERGLETSFCTASAPLPQPQPELAAGEPCETGERCEPTLECVHGYCAEECETTDDCSAATGNAFDGWCTASIGPIRHCVLGCAGASDCPEGTTCLPADSAARNEIPLCFKNSVVPGAFGKIVGEPCQAPEECEGRLCDRVCLDPCGRVNDCIGKYTVTHLDAECCLLPGTEEAFVCLAGCDDEHPCATGATCEYLTSIRGVRRVCQPGGPP